MPFYLVKDRAVWGALGIAMMLNWAWYMQGDYLYSVLTIAFDFDTMTATRVSSFYSFFSVVSGCILGLVVYKVRRLKVFIVAGTCLFLVAFGLLIRYRGDADSSSRAGVIGAQVVSTWRPTTWARPSAVPCRVPFGRRCCRARSPSASPGSTTRR